MASLAARIRQAMLARAMAEKGRQLLNRGRHAFGGVVGSAREGAATIAKSPREALRRWAEEKRGRTLNYLAEERVRTSRGRKLNLSEEEIALREKLLDAIMQGEIASWEHLKDVVNENGISRDTWSKLLTRTERSMIWQFYNPKKIGFVLRVPSPH